MTIEERADHALGGVSLDDDEERGFATGRVADAIREAVAEEREGCAATLDLIADQCEAGNPVLAFELRRVAKIFIRTRFQYASPEPPPTPKENRSA